VPVSRSGRVATFLLLLTALPPALLGCRAGESQAGLRRGDAPAAADTPSPDRTGAGLGRAAALLPLARRLTLESLSEVAERYGVADATLGRARSQLEAVTEVRLDAGLGDLAEFDEEEPTAVKLGEGYAGEIEGDDEAVVLLAHELTHAAAAGGNLGGLIEAVAAEAGRRSGVFAAEGQKEDLLCEYVGEQALKRFARMSPAGESLPERVGRAFGGGGDGDDEADEEHLSTDQTWRVLRALDPEL
jgi:hypothetical protein